MTHPPKYAQQYFVKDNCLFETGNNKQGAYTKKLCNFAPGAIREIMRDDGISFERYVQLGGIHQSGRQLPEITIPAGDVEGLGWIVKYWGMDCILEPGLKTKASVWNAIQSTALDMERITVFATTGWRHVDGNWRYLLPGDEQHTVELPGKMHGYGMERSYNQLDIQTAASLLWQSVAPEEIMLPLLSFTFLSPLNHFLKAAGCEPKFVMLLSGKTGSRKSTFAVPICATAKNTAVPMPSGRNIWMILSARNCKTPNISIRPCGHNWKRPSKDGCPKQPIPNSSSRNSRNALNCWRKKWRRFLWNEFEIKRMPSGMTA